MAACTRTEFIFLAKYPIVMNTEPLAIGMGCQKSKGVDSDSKGAGIRLSNLRFEAPRSWIEQKVMRVRKGLTTLTWLPGHLGLVGNELAAVIAKRGVFRGSSGKGMSPHLGVSKPCSIFHTRGGT